MVYEFHVCVTRTRHLSSLYYYTTYTSVLKPYDTYTTLVINSGYVRNDGVKNKIELWICRNSSSFRWSYSRAYNLLCYAYFYRRFDIKVTLLSSTDLKNDKILSERYSVQTKIRIFKEAKDDFNDRKHVELFMRLIFFFIFYIEALELIKA